MKKELKAGDKVSIELDPLSHGDGMSSLRIDVEILDVQSSIQTSDEVEFELEVAAFKVLSQTEVEYGGSNPVNLGNWDSMVGAVHTIVSVDNQPWNHTHWSLGVEFVRKEEVA